MNKRTFTLIELPVRDAGGDCIAAIGSFLQKERFEGTHRELILKTLKEMAYKLGRIPL